MLRIAARHPRICATCKSRAACFNGNDKGPGCPLSEFPRLMESNANCNLCASCIKTCPNGSISLTVRPPTEELWFIRRPRLEEAFLAVLFTALPLFGQVSPALLSLGTIQGLQYLLIVLGLLGSLYAAYRIAKSHYGASKTWPTFLPYAALVLVLGVINVGLFMLPMAILM
jgi:polyferredoxin